MKKQITMAEAQLPFTLQTWDDGSLSVVDRDGYFVLTVTPEHARKLVALFSVPEPEREPWPGQPILKGPA
jgi:hypothetical protein